MYNENKADMHIRVYRKNKENGHIEQLTKGGKWKDVTDEYNNKIVPKENDYTKKENKLL